MARQSRANVWILQPKVQHYRTPVWDELAAKAGNDYELKVIGGLEGGQAVGGGSRSYFQERSERTYRMPMLRVLSWPGTLDAVRRERPDVVVMSSNPRNVTCWRLPAVGRAVGTAMVGWSKVHSSSKVPRWLTRRVKRLFYGNMDLVICYGEESRRELLELGVPSSSARIAQNTIDTRYIFDRGEEIASRGWHLRKDAGVAGKRVLLCVGRMDSEKRQSELLKAWPEIRKLDQELVMVLVGGGRRLDEVRQRAGMVDSERIVVTGRVAVGDDYAWMATADLMVCPGAAGLAVNQSMALGTPTIIADEPGVDSEILVDQVTGWRYRKKDVRALVQAVEGVLQDRSNTLRITDAARRVMRHTVTLENMVKSVDAVIREAIILSRRRRAPKAGARSWR